MEGPDRGRARGVSPPVPGCRGEGTGPFGGACEERGAGPLPPLDSCPLVPAPCRPPANPRPEAEPAGAQGGGAAERRGAICASRVNVYIGIFMFVYIPGVRGR